MISAIKVLSSLAVGLTLSFCLPSEANQMQFRQSGEICSVEVADPNLALEVKVIGNIHNQDMLVFVEKAFRAETWNTLNPAYRGQLVQEYWTLINAMMDYILEHCN